VRPMRSFVRLQRDGFLAQIGARLVLVLHLREAEAVGRQPLRKLVGLDGLIHGREDRQRRDVVAPRGQIDAAAEKLRNFVDADRGQANEILSPKRAATGPPSAPTLSGVSSTLAQRSEDLLGGCVR